MTTVRIGAHSSNAVGGVQVTKVMSARGGRAGERRLVRAHPPHFDALIASLLGLSLFAASAIQAAGVQASVRAKPAESLYLQLSQVGLDKSRVYRVREASVHRGAIHITLEDGTIAFTESVSGGITGAYFEGQGEVLLAPPDQVERGSMAFFTGAAILEEGFTTAYLRFNDDTFGEMEPFLTAADGGAEFVSARDETARNLAGSDALRLLMTYSQFLPIAGKPPAPGQPRSPEDDHFLHARIQGRQLGQFDLYFDSESAEQTWAGQSHAFEGSVYYDVWTSFADRRKTKTMTGPTYDLSGDGEDEAFTISQYKIRTDIKPPTELNAETRLQLEVQRGGQRAVLFELSRFLQLKSIDADGQSLEFIHNPAVEGTQLARRGNDLVAVVFPEPLRAGQRKDLRFVYGGDVLSDAGGGLFYVGARGTWFPNRRLAMSNFDLEFHYPPGWTLVATGKRMDTRSLVDGSNAPTAAAEQVSRWVSERPIPLAGFNLGKFTRASARAGAVVVESYGAPGVENSFPKAIVQLDTSIDPIIPGLGPRRLRSMSNLPPPPSPARNAQTVAEASARAIEFFSHRFGPFPYSNLVLSQKPGALSQGWPGLIFLSSLSFLNEAEKSQLHMDALEKTMSSTVIAHETAHQWWGDLVGWGSYRDQWIVEALAEYSSLMLVESSSPRQFRTVMEKYRADLLRKGKGGQELMDAGPVTLGARLSSSHFPEGYEAISYGRGTWLLHMLRCMMRDAEAKIPPAKRPADEPFIRALRKLRDQYQGRSLTTPDLLKVFEEYLPSSFSPDGRKSLDWFYEGWINGTSLPRFVLEKVKYVDKGDSTVVTGTITQQDAPRNLTTPVPVYAVLGNRTALLGRVLVDEASTPFQLSSPARTRKVVLDPNQTLLTRPN